MSERAMDVMNGFVHNKLDRSPIQSITGRDLMANALTRRRMERTCSVMSAKAITIRGTALYFDGNRLQSVERGIARAPTPRPSGGTMGIRWAMCIRSTRRCITTTCNRWCIRNMLPRHHRTDSNSAPNQIRKLTRCSNKKEAMDRADVFINGSAMSWWSGTRRKVLRSVSTSRR